MSIKNLLTEHINSLEEDAKGLFEGVKVLQERLREKVAEASQKGGKISEEGVEDFLSAIDASKKRLSGTIEELKECEKLLRVLG